MEVEQDRSLTNRLGKARIKADKHNAERGDALQVICGAERGGKGAG